MRPGVAALLLLASPIQQNVCEAFSLNSLFGYETEEPEPRPSLIERFGEEGYKERLVSALGEEIAGVRSDETGGAKKVEYGVDISYPIHRYRASENYDWFHFNQNPGQVVPRQMQGQPVQIMGNKQREYINHMKGCWEFYEESSCKQTEKDRVHMNLRQPQSMQNYTDIGVKKIRAPAYLMDMLTEFYEKNKHLAEAEKWPRGNTYTNHWASPTYMLNVEQSAIPGGGPKLKAKIYEAAKGILEEWSGETLTPVSLYGIRTYKEGSILAPHVDRLPLVTSAIINVAQDVDEEWPIEVYAHDGKAYNVTMQPGDMVLYESHSVIHGRPFPLKGRFFSNVFIHFEPTGHTLRHEESMLDGDAEEQYAKVRKMKRTAKNEDNDLPHYIIKGTPEEKRWRQKNPKIKEDSSFTGTNSIHTAAASGQLDFLKKVAEDDKEILQAKDKNGWMPLHEAARGGHVNVAEFLVQEGSDINARTNNNRGGSVMWWAKESHDEDHPMIKYLEKLGAEYIEPEL